MLLLASLAFAGSSATSFATDAGDWEGGTLGDGVLRIEAGEAALAIDGMVTFQFTARVRVVDGDALTLAFGDQAFTATYGQGGALAFAGQTAPFAVDERSFEADSSPVLTLPESVASIADPDVVSFAGRWFMAFTATDVDGTTSIALATSADLATWEPNDDPAVAYASAPALTTNGATLSVLAARSGSIVRADSADGQAFTEFGTVLGPGPDFDAGGLDHPTVTLDDGGGWHLWYNAPDSGSTGYATSADGTSFTREGAIADDDDRLYAVDVVDGAFELEAVYSMGDSLGWARGGADPTFADEARDLRPIASASDASWADGGLGGPAVVYDGDDAWIFAAGNDDGAPVIGRFRGVPTPGSWASLVVTWDGETVTTSWNGGPTMTGTLSELDGFVLSTDGTIEIDEVDVQYSQAGDAADTADTGVLDTADTGVLDTAGEDTGAGDERDTATGDESDTGPAGYNAGEWLGDPGGCGCDSPDLPIGGLISVTGAMALCSRSRRAHGRPGRRIA